jgi:hypothetical protein
MFPRASKLASVPARRKEDRLFNCVSIAMFYLVEYRLEALRQLFGQLVGLARMIHGRFTLIDIEREFLCRG